MAPLTATAIATLALAEYEDVLAAAVTITLLTGIFLRIMAVLRLGLLANFISYPVMKGVLFGLALPSSSVRNLTPWRRKRLRELL